VIAPDRLLGTWEYDGTPFTGVFDGNNKTIAHLKITGAGFLGLFGQLASGAEIKNLGVVDANVAVHSWGANVGCLVGLNDYAKVVACYSAGTVRGSRSVGGLVGGNKGTLTSSYSTATVHGDEQVGGLVGGTFDSTIAQCYSAGRVIGSSSVGGLLGYCGSAVTECYSTGTVSGNSSVGGLAGLIGYGTVTRCYSIGAVSGNSSVGGLVGSNSIAAVTQCFWDTQTSGQATSAGGTGKATAEMQMQSTFTDAGWDFNDVWVIWDGYDYPRLQWEPGAGLVFVDVPAGTFEMGDHDGVGRPAERPVHAVTLDGFQMSKYETTNAQYAQFLNAAMADGLIQVYLGAVVYASSDNNRTQPYCDVDASIRYCQIEYTQGRFTVRTRDGKSMANHPVVYVGWYGAKAFCDYYGYRLPTEAEWEYAARGGYHNPYYQYPWGSNTIDCSKANYWNGSSSCNPLNLTRYPYTSPVGYYGPQGAYGLCDMSGNVSEWCQDWYGLGYYSVSPAGNPTGPDTGGPRVLRGGSWHISEPFCRVAARSWRSPSSGEQAIGFRVCR